MKIFEPQWQISILAKVIPWVIITLGVCATVLVLIACFRWIYRIWISRHRAVFEVSFGSRSEDLPLRSEMMVNIFHAIKLAILLAIFEGQPHLSLVYSNEKGVKRLHIFVPVVKQFPMIVEKALKSSLRGCKITRDDHFVIPVAVCRRKHGRVVPKRHPVFPIKTHKGYENHDPIENLLSSMDFEDGDGSSCIFLMLKPCGEHWKKRGREIQDVIRAGEIANMDLASRKSRYLSSFTSEIVSLFIEGARSAFESGSDLESGQNKYRPLDKDKRTELSDEVKAMVKAMGDKLGSQANFRYDVRLLAEHPKASFRDIDRMASPFRQYDLYQIFKWTHTRWPISMIVDWRLRHNYWPIIRPNGILSSDECAGFLHNPDKSVIVPGLTLNLSRAVPAHHDLTQTGPDRLLLGYNDYEATKKPVSLPFKDFSRHSMIMGKTGVGKTTLVINNLLQWIDSGIPDAPRGACFIEPHGDACRDFIDAIPERHIDRVHFVNPMDPQYSLAFNPLAYKDLMTVDQLANSFLAALKAYWEITPEMPTLLTYMTRSVHLLLQLEGAHLGWVRPFLTDEEFRNSKLCKIHDPDTLQFWEVYSNKPSRMKYEEIRSLLNRLDALLLDSRMQSIFAQPQSKLDFLDIMDNGKILVCHFGDSNTGTINKRILGNLLCSYFHQACQVRDKERRPFLLCLDECAEYLTPNLGEILSEDRKFGLVMSLSFQYLDQVRELLPALKGNVGTPICFQVGEQDATALAPVFSSSSDSEELIHRADDLMNLGPFQAFIKASVGGRPLPPTTFALPEPHREHYPDNISTAITNARRNLCRSRTEIQIERCRFFAQWGTRSDDNEGQVQF